MEERLITLIREKGAIPEQKLDSAIQERHGTNELLLEAIVRMGMLSRERVTQLWAEATGYPYVDLNQIKPDKELVTELVNVVPKELAERFHLVPFGLDNGTIQVGMYNPANVMAIDALWRATGKRVDVFLANSESIATALSKFYQKASYYDEELERHIAFAHDGLTELQAGDSSVVQVIVDLIIKKGIFEGATDIHVSPDEKTTRLSYRIDGEMRMSRQKIHKRIHASIISCLKVLSGMNIAEKRVPQDGNISFEYSGRYVDIRVSTSPTDEGENAVLRLLDKSNVVQGLENIGLSPRDAKEIKKLSSKPYGIILSAGPTGSGKTTTLYSLLQELDAIRRNILTIEDPIEYRLAYIKQTQVNKKAGLSFATAIRHFLRQDPDVILVGEIRDYETARIAFQAAMTGHLVLSTIHTNHASACIARLMDLGIEPYLIASSLMAVVAQRLVRKVCLNCVTEVQYNDAEIADFNLGPDSPASEKRGQGCDQCGGTGYKGRTGIFEILPIIGPIKEMIHQKRPDRLLDHAREAGMRTMHEDGIDKVRKEITTMAEVIKVAGDP